MALNNGWTLNLGKLLRINFGKTGISFTFGPRGLRHTVNTNGRVTTSFNPLNLFSSLRTLISRSLKRFRKWKEKRRLSRIRPLETLPQSEAQAKTPNCDRECEPSPIESCVHSPS